MPSSSVRTFSDADEFTGAIRHAALQLTFAERGNFTADLTQITLHQLWLQALSESLKTIHHNNYWGGRAGIGYYTRSGPGVLDGVEMSPGSITRFGPGQSYNQRFVGPTSAHSVSLPLGEMEALSVVAGHDVMPGKDHLIVTPSPNALARLHRLHVAAGHLAENVPDILEYPEAARGLEQALIEAMMDCLGGDVHENTLAQRKHAIVMRRFHRFIEQYPEQPPYVAEICKAIRVSERTLWACCQEHLGMSPKRYLTLRRMRLVQQALSKSTPADTAVTRIATHYGFWELGRFAGQYKALFGETPSTTLRRSA